ncbi:hypothetical protein DFH07DRAFT_956285 [Mycena maculata]|uniref:Uncharacterized protein n=1 Tax=Mycena maculata TaxID=230809 RepID=A0AAD7JIC1_9AGAR|nr:hypothetical protein DFH07DRAFT_956285 [Mycena maculata]
MTISAILSKRAIPTDGSWDDALYVRMRREGGEVIFERDRAGERHAKLKEPKEKAKGSDARFEALEETLGKLKKALEESQQRHDASEAEQRRLNVKQLRATIMNLEEHIKTMVLVEEYEVVDGALRAFSDRVYEVRPDGLSYEEKQTLKDNNVPYILQLLDVPEPTFRFLDPRATAFDRAVWTAISLLTSEEWDFCYLLRARRNTLCQGRNSAQRPWPDRSTAELWLNRIAPGHQETVRKLLDDTPCLMRTSQDNDLTDLHLVVKDSEYEGPEVLLADLRCSLDYLEREEAARGDA